MEIFKIEIQEFLARVVEVKAKDISMAISKVKKKYDKTEIVLDYNDFVDVEFIDINQEDKPDEKTILINEVINYLYSEEKKHFEELNEPKDHIFLKLERIKCLL